VRKRPIVRLASHHLAHSPPTSPTPISEVVDSDDMVFSSEGEVMGLRRGDRGNDRVF
jgi:hypothetical protein